MNATVWARATLAVLLVLTGMSGAVRAQTTPAAERWAYSLTPYFWLPLADGTLKYQLPPGSGSPGVEVESDKLALDAGFMLAGEARRGRWSMFGDYIYLKLSSLKSTVRSVDFNTGAPAIPATLDTGTETELKGNVLTLAGGYSLAGSAQSPLDVIGGVRYFNLTATTDWRISAAVAGAGAGQTFAAAGNSSQSVDLWDAIIGLRGRARLGEKWTLPYHFDVGTGSSKLTWQALAGLSYAFGWGEVTLAYRHLVYDQKDSKLIQDFKFSGPLLGATFRF